MVNLIKNLLILAMFGNIILPMAGYTMEKHESTSEDKKQGHYWKKFRNRKEVNKKQRSKEFSPESPEWTIQENDSLCQETSTEAPSPPERGELDYRAEHERVRALLKDVSKRNTNLNLDNRGIFSLPNDTDTMKKLSNCRYLNFSHNMLDALPDEICEWTSMISLDLSNNKLTIVPWQVIGLFDTSAPKVSIFLTDNPIKRIPPKFFKAMMAQEGHRGDFSGFSIEFNQDIIENYIFPKLKKSPFLKSYLVKSFHGDILNGFCKIQNESGAFLSFDKDEQPFFAYGQGTSL